MASGQPSTTPPLPGARGVRVRVEHLRRIFSGSGAVIDGLDLDVAAGSFVALLGPSGCGKSTLLRVVAGLDRPDAGAVMLEGGAAGARVAFVFQDAHLLPWRNVLDNAALPLELAGAESGPRRDEARRALADVGLGEATTRLPHELSGGMRMRVSLARALVTRPDLLLLDEPFAALDEMTRQRLDDQLRTLWARLGLTVLFVTHSVDEAAYLAERAVVFSARPARVVGDHALDLPRDRTAALRTEPAFAKEARALRDALEREAREMRVLRALAPPLLALAVLVATWEALARALDLPLYLLPPPSAIVRAAAGSLGDLALAASVTARAALYGFLLSAVLGTLSAIVLSASRVLERALYPYTVFLQTVPIVAIAPLLVLWFGAGMRAVTISAFIVSVFPVIANTLAGIRSVEPPLRDLFRLYGASRLATLRKLEFPSALPSLMTGLRVAAGLAVIGAIVGEFVAGFSESGAGLGILILSSYRQLRTDLLFAAVLFASMLGLLLFGAVNLASHVLLSRWHPSARDPQGGS